MENTEWSIPYHGLSHLGPRGGQLRASIQVLVNGSVILSKWWRGCGFSPLVEVFTSIDGAKAAGEAWVSSSRLR